MVFKIRQCVDTFVMVCLCSGVLCWAAVRVTDGWTLGCPQASAWDRQTRGASH